MKTRTGTCLALVVLVLLWTAGCGGGGGGGGNGGGTIPIGPSGDNEPNQPPCITSISPKSSSTTPIALKTSERLTLVVSAADPDNDNLQYSWTCSAGTITGISQEATYTAPGSPCVSVVTIGVNDGHNGNASANVYIVVGGATDPLPQNQPPVVTLGANPSSIQAGGTSTLTASASDPDGDPLTYTWIVNAGSIKTHNKSSIVWLAPNAGGRYSVTVGVSDGKAEAVLASTAVSVISSTGVDPGPVETFTNGLKARYYQNDGDVAHPIFTEDNFVFERIDANVNFSWDKSAPHPDLADSADGTASNYSVRWTGYVRCEKPGSYTFQVKYDDGARLWIIDDKNEVVQLIDAWETGPSTKTAIVTLEGSKWYPIKLEYFEDKSSAYVMLYWIPPGATTREIIPTTALRTD